MKLIAILLMVCLLNSCSMGDAVVLGAAGAAGTLAHELSDGDEWITAGAAAGTLLAGAAIKKNIEDTEKEKYETGFKDGQAQAAKDNYWYIQRMQKNMSRGPHSQPQYIYNEYEFPGVQKKDGINYLPHTVKLRVIEDVKK